jgi:NADPH:quinone reductase-like Zn-dependent oxidoreductase
MTATQRAAIYAEFGGPEVIRIVRVPVPEPAPGEAIVEVRAVGLNPYDAKARTGFSPSPVPLPRGIGGDVAGVVTAVAPGAEYADGSPIAVGDAVLGWTMGAARERVAVPAGQLARKPPGLPFAVAGSLSTAGQTAVASLSVAPVAHGETVLVTAAAGSVGFLYSQLAIRTGARVVGTASQSNHERLRAIGVVPVDYGPGLAARVRAAAPEGIAAVQDNVGGDSVELALDLGVPPSRICEIVDHAATERLGLASPGRYERRADVLADLARQVAAGELSLPVFREFPLDEVVAAFQLLETRHLSGKIVLVP